MTIFNTYARKSTLLSLVMAVLVVTGLPISTYADECTPHNYFIVSNTETEIATDTPAVLTYDESPFWIDIAGASWIWESYLVANPAEESHVTFTRNFLIEGEVTAAELAIAGDDYFAVYINGEEITNEYDVFSIESNFTEVKRYPIDSHIFNQGDNVMTINSTNAPYFYGDSFATPYNNPAGTIFVLSIDSASCSDENTSSSTSGGSNNGGNAPKDAQFINAFSGGIGGNPEDTFFNTSNNFASVLGSPDYAYAHNTDTDTTTLKEDTLSESEVSPLLASALSALPNVDLTCSIIALIIVLLLYIAWLIIPSRRSSFDTSHNAQKMDLHKLAYLVGGLILILIILYILSLSCVVFPLLIMFILMILGVYLKII